MIFLSVYTAGRKTRVMAVKREVTNYRKELITKSSKRAVVLQCNDKSSRRLCGKMSRRLETKAAMIVKIVGYTVEYTNVVKIM